VEKCLDSLTKQQVKQDDFEVIVVDNNSSDSTAEAVAAFGQRLPNLKYVVEQNQGLSHARNRGYAEAKGEYLVYLDDDVVAPPEYLTNILAVICQHAPDIMGGPVYPFYTTPKPRWFKDEFEIRCYAEASGFSTTCSVSGGNYIIRREVLQALGPFDPEYGMRGNSIGMLEEYKMLRLYRQRTETEKQRVYYSLEAKVFHHVPPNKMNLKYMCQRRWVTGEAWYRLEFQNLPWQHLIRTLVRALYSLIRGTRHRIWRYGLFSLTPLILLCRDVFYYLGFISGYFKTKRLAG